MEVIKIALFLYAIVSPVVSRDSGRRLYYEPSWTNDNCICYPRNEIYASVPEIIDPQNNGFERLVIYIFKDVHTNEIKVYTPNSRKQNLIPDLPFEIGDGLISINDELANNIFYNNPHRIVLNKVRNKITDNINGNGFVHNKNWDENNPNIIVNNGVHQQHWYDKNPIEHKEIHNIILDDNNPKIIVDNGVHHKNWNHRNTTGFVHNEIHHNIWAVNNPNGIVHNGIHRNIWDIENSNVIIHNGIHHKNWDGKNPTRIVHNTIWNDGNPNGIDHNRVRHKYWDSKNPTKFVHNEIQHDIWDDNYPNRIIHNGGHRNIWDDENSNVIINNGIHHKNWDGKNPTRIVHNKVHHKIWADKNPNGIVHNGKHYNIWDDNNAKRIEHNKLKDGMIETPIGPEVENIVEINHENIANIYVSNNEEEFLPKVKAVDNCCEDDNNIWPEMSSIDTQVDIRPKVSPWHGDIKKWAGINNHKSYWYPEKHWDIDSETPEDLRYIFDIKPKSNVKHYVNPEKYAPNTQNVIGNKQYLNFDTWFIQQMRSFVNVNLPGDIDSINSVALRSLIEKTLKENNIYVTADRILTDSHGNALDVSNLELRPMLLGSPVAYKKVLDGGSGNLKLPKDLPYLEGILITLVYPPKVLGIIPLGKTTLSRVFSPKKTKESSVKISAVTKSVSNVANSHKSILDRENIPKITSKSPQNKHTESIVTKIIPKRPVIKHEIILGNQKIKVGKHVAKKTKSKLKIMPDDLNEPNPEKDDQSRKLITGNFLKKMHDMLSDSRQGQDDYESDDEDEPYFNELPDFRIIGGYAATSSGAPVSNKGRSGIHI